MDRWLERLAPLIDRHSPSEPHAVPRAALVLSPPASLCLFFRDVVGAGDPALDALTAGERARAGRYATERLAMEWATSRAVLREVLGRVTNTEPALVPLVVAGAGKPRTQGVEFSLSRSGASVLIALSPTVVGVDLQDVPTLRVVADVTPLLHPEEASALAAIGPAERPVAFARTWARKEALLKARGTGLGRDTTLDLVGAGREPEQPDDAFTITDLRVPERSMRAALCLEGGSARQAKTSE